MSGGISNGNATGPNRNGDVDGILNVDKPPGITSMDVVRRIKRASRQKRVGHGGTLDPVATGVIPICMGQATRMMEFLIDGTREYRAVIELGIETDTYDVVGEVTNRKDPSSVARQDVERSLEPFKGSIEQVPPMYSALKRQGKRLYELARAGVEVEREPRRVEVLSIELVEWAPPVVTIDVTCGRGFYMRSLAHDLGQALGCGAHIKGLVRLRSGPFKISESMSLGDMEQMFAEGTWQKSLCAPDIVVSHMRAAIVGKQVEEMVRHGRPIPQGMRIPFSRPNEQCRVYGTDGRFIAILSFNASMGQWQPHRVFTFSYGREEDGQ